VLAVGHQAGIQQLRPHRLHRVRADPARAQALLGHASVETAGWDFRAGANERAAVVKRAFE
jgi:hypothetical protein